MTERERLTEILKAFCTEDCKITHQCGYCDYGDLPVCASAVADHLLANGVIVPPCKVGDTVYTISRGRPKKWKVCFIGQNTQEEQKYHLADEGYKHMIEAWNYDIGKTVFLSREDAEKALKERSEGK